MQVSTEAQTIRCNGVQDENLPTINSRGAVCIVSAANLAPFIALIEGCQKLVDVALSTRLITSDSCSRLTKQAHTLQESPELSKCSSPCLNLANPCRKSEISLQALRQRWQRPRFCHMLPFSGVRKTFADSQELAIGFPSPRRSCAREAARL